MHQQAFIKLEDEQVLTLLTELNAVTDGADFVIGKVTVMIQSIPFYEGYSLLDLTNHGVTPNRRAFYIYKENDIHPINWTHEQIYNLNEAIPIKLTEDNINDYVRFFLVFAKGKHGRFLLLESIDEINWKEEPPPAARKTISKMVKSLEIRSCKDDGTFVLRATILLKDSIFSCDIEVSTNGNLKIYNEDLLIESLPIIDDTYGS